MEPGYSKIMVFIYNTRDWLKYLRGGCYDFYLKLKKRFPSAEAYYNSDHVITKIGENYYDATGKVEKTNHLKVNDHYDHEKLKKMSNG